MQLKLPFLASWPLGSVLLPLKRKRFLFSRSLLVSCSPHPPTACRESKRERNTHDCSYSINRSHCTSSLVIFKLLADAQPLPPPSYRKSHCIALICSKKKTLTEIYSQSVPKGHHFTQTQQCIQVSPSYG